MPKPYVKPMLICYVVKVVRSFVVSGKRTVVLSRPSLGATKLHANFSLQDLEVPWICPELHVLSFRTFKRPTCTNHNV